MLSDKLWNNRYARWVALGCFLAGHASFLIGKYLTRTFWPGYICLAVGLILWIVPVTWCAYKFSKS